MVLAERWLGFGTIAACGLLLAASLAQPAPPTTPPPQHVELTSYRCSEPRHPLPPPPVDDDPYATVFATAQPAMKACFGAETRVELLITIAPDGHVAKVSHRPDPSTPATRCLTDIAMKLKFPATENTLAIRLPLTSE